MQSIAYLLKFLRFFLLKRLIFQFSIYDTILSEMNIKTNKQLIELILSEYSIGRVTSIEQLYTGYVNLSYVINTDNKGSNGKYFLRIYNTPIEKDVVFQHSILNYLYFKKFHLVPGLIKTKRGEIICYSSYKKRKLQKLCYFRLS